ncbi:proton-coupled folate transporter [Athalia rosae]|uniref:proton-coupled folate transporter n=1 Tax=Athalia rosae TaxID=37344 RepID=UPI0020348EE9|nr:proton-coupled folate transporter [Athalia rosae]
MALEPSTESEPSQMKVEGKPGICIEYFGWIRHTTVEPTMWLYMIAFMLTSVVEQSFFVDKSCRVDHGLSAEICSNLSANATLLAQVQMTVSSFHQWNNIASHAVPIVLALFFGSWSDRRGRKAPLVIALIGKLIYSGMIVVNSLMDTWNLNMVVYTASIPSAMLGSDVAIFASCFAYVSDVSSSAQRTMRVSILDAVYLSTIPTGVALGSYLYSSVVNSSYSIMFLINATLILLAIVYSAIRLEMRTTPQQKPLERGNNIVADFFDKEHVFASIRTLIKPRADHKRLYIWILMLAMVLYVFQRDERQMSYLYTQSVFSWDITTFSQFRTFQSSLFVVAMMLGVPLMSKFLGMRDTLIIVIGSISHALGRVFYAVATGPGLFYAGAGIAALGPVTAPVLRSMTSKVVHIKERGRIFAILSVCDNAVPLFSGVLYSQLYNATIHTVPSAIYWLTFSTQIAVFLLIMVIHVTLGKRQLESDGHEKTDLFSDDPANSTPIA